MNTKQSTTKTAMKIDAEVCSNFIYKLFKNGNLWSFTPAQSNKPGFQYYGTVHQSEKYKSGLTLDDEIGAVLLPIYDAIINYLIDNNIVLTVDISDLDTRYPDVITVKGHREFKNQIPYVLFNSALSLAESQTDLSEFKSILS